MRVYSVHLHDIFIIVLWHNINSMRSIFITFISFIFVKKKSCVSSNTAQYNLGILTIICLVNGYPVFFRGQAASGCFARESLTRKKRAVPRNFNQTDSQEVRTNAAADQYVL